MTFQMMSVPFLTFHFLENKMNNSKNNYWETDKIDFKKCTRQNPIKYLKIDERFFKIYFLHFPNFELLEISPFIIDGAICIRRVYFFYSNRQRKFYIKPVFSIPG